MKCQHEHCEETEVTECFLPDNETEIPDEYYCAEHAAIHGYCYICGQFWGGVERFDFASFYGGIQGVCENCEAGLDLREDEDEEIYELY